MKAVILAAGRGERLRPLTDDRPKALIEVTGKPVIWHIVNALPSEIDELILIIGYKGDMIRAYCGDEFLGKKVHYVTQAEQTGDAHALLLARPFLQDERFLMLYGDNIIDADGVARCLEHDKAMLVYEVDNPEIFGAIITNQDGTIAGLVEKSPNPPSNLINTGVIVFDTSIFDYEPVKHENGEYYTADMFGKWVKDYKVQYEVARMWLPIGTPEDIVEAEKTLNQS